jgi:methyltransferase family protein
MPGSLLSRMFGFWRRRKISDPDESLGVPPDDDLGWLWPPSDVHDAAAWDRHWHNQVANGLAPPIFDIFCDDQELVKFLDARKMKTVLCVGNGLSQEPRALAAAGFDVTAIDLSSEGCRLAQLWTFDKKQLAQYILPEQQRPGGHARFVVGDIMDPTVCPGPYDAIVERCTLQLFPTEERSAALEALEHRLSPQGLLRSNAHNGGWRPGEPREHPLEPLLTERGWEVTHSQPGSISNPESTTRQAWLSLSTG